MLKTIANGKVAVRLRFGVRPAEDRPGTANRVDGRALAAAAVTVVLWASAFVSIRSSAGHFGPGALAGGRLLVGAVVLGALLLARREGLPPREAWRGIAGSGILWFGAYMVALNGGEHEVDAGTASMVVNVGPILIALLSGWLLKEGFPPRLLAGMAVSFAGAVVVGLSLSGGGASSLPGVALCLVAAVTYAVGVVLQKPALKHPCPRRCKSSTWASSRPPSPSARGPTRSPARPPGRWAPRRMRCRCWRSSCRGPSSTRSPAGSPSSAACSASRASRSPARAGAGAAGRQRRSPLPRRPMEGSWPRTPTGRAGA